MMLAVAIGANDETFAPIIGIKALSINKAVALGGSIVIIGASTLGFRVAKTVGTDIAASPFTFNQMLTILVVVSIILILGSYAGLPLSTTHATVGATVALSLIVGLEVDLWTIQKIGLSWIVSPVVGFLGSFIIIKALMAFKRSYIKGLDDVDRLESIFVIGLFAAVCFTAFSRGANDVSNAVAPIIGSFITLAAEQDMSILARVPLIGGGIFMAIGLIIVGRRVLKTLGNDVVQLSPTTAFAVQLSTALITFISANLGIPISGTHVLVSSFIGVGVGYKLDVNKGTVAKIAVSAVATPLFAGLLTAGSWYVISALL